MPRVMTPRWPALQELSRQVDVIVLAQASMARVVDTLSAEDRRVPILDSPASRWITWRRCCRRTTSCIRRQNSAVFDRCLGGLPAAGLGLAGHWQPALIWLLTAFAISLRFSKRFRGYQFTAWIVAVVVAATLYPDTFCMWPASTCATGGPC